MIYNRYIKRLLDFVLGIILLPFVLLVSVPIAIFIKLDDGGPIFYKGKRLGKNMKPFAMYKFRSMKVNAPDLRNQDGSTYNAENDPRLTSIGKVLRKTSLDELPQVFNVINGTMSFIGPRPSPLGNEKLYSKEYLVKFKIRPGITGYNQALLRNSATMEERWKNDIYYTTHLSFVLDIKIIFLTLKTVLLKKNIYRNEERQ